MKEIKKAAKGFSLIELLVVVLIIGILAAIALPQYKMAVAKAQFATLKANARSLMLSAQRHYLIHSTKISSINDLDIDFNLKGVGADEGSLYLYFHNGSYCTVWKSTTQVSCTRVIFGHSVAFYDFGNWKGCVAFSLDRNTVGNRLCKQETGDKGDDNPSGYVSYSYK